MVDGVLYASNGIGLIEAFDPGTAATLWVQQPFPQDGAQGLRGDSKRGLAYWTSGAERRLLTVQGEYLVAVDAATGRPVAGFGDGGRVNLTVGIPKLQRYSWTGVPVVCRDVVIVGAAGFSDAPRRKENPPGDVQAFDVRTGKPKWTFHAIPRPDEFGIDTWLDESWEYGGNANLWSLLSADEELGYAYLPLTSPSVDMYGGHRPGDNLFGNSLVAVRCDTGARVWHHQLVHHDL
jgi:quinoprotein glucose dehydrogenase